jgi:selenium metabolism protein YedF
MKKVTILDCKGLVCPAPVVKTKQNIESGNLPLSIILDNKMAIENVSRMAAKHGCIVENLKEEAGLFILTIVNASDSERETGGDNANSLNEYERNESTATDFTNSCYDSAPSVIYIGSDEMGTGDRRLGTLLMNGFIKTIRELTPLPSAIIFVNSGIKLTLNNSKATVTSLMELSDKGVELLVCGTCLDFYNAKDELAVGRISNMFEIGDTLNTAFRVVRP